MEGGQEGCCQETPAQSGLSLLTCRSFSSSPKGRAYYYHDHWPVVMTDKCAITSASHTSIPHVIPPAHMIITVTTRGHRHLHRYHHRVRSVLLKDLILYLSSLHASRFYPSHCFLSPFYALGFGDTAVEKRDRIPSSGNFQPLVITHISPSPEIITILRSTVGWRAEHEI